LETGVGDEEDEGAKAQQGGEIAEEIARCLGHTYRVDCAEIVVGYYRFTSIDIERNRLA
jgi:hypothetical protein